MVGGVSGKYLDLRERNTKMKANNNGDFSSSYDSPDIFGVIK